MEIIQNMAFTHMKRCSTLLLGEIQIETIIQYFSRQMSKIKQLIVRIRARANSNSRTMLVRVQIAITPLKVNFDII